MERLIVAAVTPPSSPEPSYLPWIALVVALASIPITVWATRRWGNRRAKVSISVTSTPLIPDDATRLAVTYRDIPVESPHLVTVVMRNTGPRDVASSMFDSGNPTVVSFDSTFYGVTATRGGVQLISSGIGATPPDSKVGIAPALLKRKSEWAFSVVVTGPVEAELRSTLVDTDLIEEVSATDSGAKLSLQLAGLRAEFPIRQRRPIR